MSTFHLYKGKILTIFVIIFLIMVFLGEIIISKYGLTVTKYKTVTDRVSTPLRIVQITDLHNSEFGVDNNRLVQIINKQMPDLILVTGDLLNSDSKVTDIATNLLLRLSEIAPVYVSLGNHEIEYAEKYAIDIKNLYESTGVTVLDKQYEDIAVNDQKIRLGGIYGYCVPDRYLETGEANLEECNFLKDFQNTNYYSVLMCHMPVCWIENSGIDEWDIDLILAGHAHGGQIRIPFIGGLRAPDQGWFPGQERGLYYSSDSSKVMVLSRGLGSRELIPRFNNIPEIVVVDVMPE